MKTTGTIICALAVSLSSAVIAQDKNKMSDEEKAWMSYMTPGPEHKQLAESNGLWDEDITMWAGPDAQPTTSKSTVASKMILGGRYQQSTHRGSFEGMPFEGISLMGFDNKKKVYVSSWIDNMGTGMMIMEGKWNDDKKAVEFNGTMVDPVSGKDLKVRELYFVRDSSNHVMEMYQTTEKGKEYKNMEIHLKRREMPKSKGIYIAPEKLPQRKSTVTKSDLIEKQKKK